MLEAVDKAPAGNEYPTDWCRASLVLMVSIPACGNLFNAVPTAARAVAAPTLPIEAARISAKRLFILSDARHGISVIFIGRAALLGVLPWREMLSILKLADGRIVHDHIDCAVTIIGRALGEQADVYAAWVAYSGQIADDTEEPGWYWSLIKEDTEGTIESSGACYDLDVNYL